MITLAQYFGPHATCADRTPQTDVNATVLLGRVNALIAEMQQRAGVVFLSNPATGTQISGQTLGGFRPLACTQGSLNSAHKQGQAVDLYDPYNQIDQWLLQNPDALVHHDLYIEHPAATNGWSHWGTRAPKSGKRVFYP
jgi:hypothetical protein